MPTIQKKDRREGTALWHGPADFRRSGARRRMFVDGLGGTRADLEEAIGLALLTNDVLIHPDLGLTVDRLMATSTRDGEVELVADYMVNARNPNAGFTHVNLSTGQISVEETRSAATDTDFNVLGQKKDGKPYVQEMPDAGLLLITRTRPLPVWLLTVNTVLTFNPASIIGPYQFAKVNKDPVTWDGFTLQAGQVRFDGANIDWRADKFYFVTYHFTIAPTFLQVRRVWNSVASQVQEVDDVPYLTRSFTAPGFPIG